MIKKIFNLPSLLVLAIFSTQMALDFYVPSLPMVASYFEVDEELAQLTLTWSLIGFAFGSLMVGPISDVYGRRKTLLVSYVVFVISTFLCAISPSIHIFIFIRFIQGIAASCAPIMSLAMVKDLYAPKEASRLMSVMGAAIALSPATAPFLGGYITYYYDWRMCFWILAIASVIILVPIYLYLPETLKKQEKHMVSFSLKEVMQGYFETLKNWNFIRVALISSMFVSSIWVYVGNAPFIFEKMGVGPAEFGMYYGIGVGGYVLGSALNSIFGGRFSFHATLSLGFVLIISGSGCLMYLSYGPNIVPMTMALTWCVYSFGLALVFPITNTMAMNAGKKSGTSASLLNGLELLFSSFGIMIVGGKHNSSFVGVALFCILTSVIAFAIYRLGKKQQY